MEGLGVTAIERIAGNSCELKALIQTLTIQENINSAMLHHDSNDAQPEPSESESRTIISDDELKLSSTRRWLAQGNGNYHQVVITRLSSQSQRRMR